jgi:hypothetical protein
VTWGALGGEQKVESCWGSSFVQAQLRPCVCVCCVLATTGGLRSSTY